MLHWALSQRDGESQSAEKSQARLQKGAEVEVERGKSNHRASSGRSAIEAPLPSCSPALYSLQCIYSPCNLSKLKVSMTSSQNNIG